MWVKRVNETSKEEFKRTRAKRNRENSHGCARAHALVPAQIVTACKIETTSNARVGRPVSNLHSTHLKMTFEAFTHIKLPTTSGAGEPRNVRMLSFKVAVEGYLRTENGTTNATDPTAKRRRIRASGTLGMRPKSIHETNGSEDHTLTDRLGFGGTHSDFGFKRGTRGSVSVQLVYGRERGMTMVTRKIKEILRVLGDQMVADFLLRGPNRAAVSALPHVQFGFPINPGLRHRFRAG